MTGNRQFAGAHMVKLLLAIVHRIFKTILFARKGIFISCIHNRAEEELLGWLKVRQEKFRAFNQKETSLYKFCSKNFMRNRIMTVYTS